MPLWDPFLDAIQAMSRCGRAEPHALDNVTLGEWITFHTFMAALGASSSGESRIGALRVNLNIGFFSITYFNCRIP